MSEESLTKAKQLWSDVGASEGDKPEPMEEEGPALKTEPSFAGFKTGSGKTVQVSEEAKERAKRLWAESEENSDAIPRKQLALKSGGIRPAIEGRVAISAGALDKASRLWKSAPQEETNENSSKPSSAKVSEVKTPAVAEATAEPTNDFTSPLPSVELTNSAPRRVGLSRRPGSAAAATLQQTTPSAGSPFGRPGSSARRTRLPFKAPTRVAAQKVKRLRLEDEEAAMGDEDSQEFEAEVGQWMEQAQL